MKPIELFKSAALAGLAGMALSGAAMAQAPAFTFSVQAVNLEEPTQVAEVYARLNGEAAAYCDRLIEDGAESEMAKSLCLEDVVHNVVQRIDHPGLSEYHARARGSAETRTASLY